VCSTDFGTRYLQEWSELTEKQEGGVSEGQAAHVVIHRDAAGCRQGTAEVECIAAAAGGGRSSSEGGRAALASLCGRKPSPTLSYEENLAGIAMSRLVEAPLHKYSRHMSYLQILVSVALSY
jgi:hypothetical protein